MKTQRAINRVFFSIYNASSAKFNSSLPFRDTFDEVITNEKISGYLWCHGKPLSEYSLYFYMQQTETKQEKIENYFFKPIFEA